MTGTNIDGVIAALGNPGKAQCCLALIISLFMTIVSMHHLSMVFMGATPPHHCKVSSNFPLNETIPMARINGREMPDRCRMYIDPTNHSLGTTECTNGWTYLYQRGEWSVIGEFNLVCKYQYLVGLVSTVYFSGTVVGSVVFGYLADRVGRKPVYLTTLYAHALIGVVQYFSDTYTMFLVFKFLHGMLVQGMYATLLCLVMELFHTAWRTEASIFMNLMYTTGQFVLVFLSYFNPNWRYFYLASTLPALGAIIYIWIVPESLRWLLVNQRRSEALALSQWFARINNITLDSCWPQKIALVVEKHSAALATKHKQPDVRDLFRTPYIRRTSLLIVYLWFSMAFVYFGINFSLPSLDGDKYLNFAISVAVEFVCRSLTYPGLKLIGRRISGSICFLLTGITCVASAVVNYYLEAPAIATGLAIFARAAGSSTFVCVMLQTQESFPTVLRSNALGLGGVFNRFGSMAAPQVVLLGVYTHRMVPFVVLGAVAVIAAFVTLLMPETFQSPLPDTLEQAEKLNSKQKLPNAEDFDGATKQLEEQNSDCNHNHEMVRVRSIKAFISPGDAKAPVMETSVGSEVVQNSSADKSMSPPSPAILYIDDCSAKDSSAKDSMPQNLLKELKTIALLRNQRVFVVSKVCDEELRF